MNVGSDDDRKSELPLMMSRNPSAYIAGGALIPWRCFWACVLPLILAGFAASLATGFWYGAAGIGGLTVLYLTWFIVTVVFFRSSFQLWALQRPGNWLVRLLLPAIEAVDSLRAGDPRSVLYLYEKWGSNFCAAGQVWLGSFADVSAALKGPQARTFCLGEHPLVPSSLPGAGTGRCVFLLSLSDRAAGGSGDHEAFRNCLLHYLLTPEAHQRETDATSLRLLDELAKDYKEMDAASFYSSCLHGNQAFWIKYLHHVLFDLSIDDPDVVATLQEMHGGMLPLFHYLHPMGHAMSYGSRIAKVAALYETSPALDNFQENDPAYNRMTKQELCMLMVAVMRIAGVQGSQVYVFVTTGGTKHGYIPVDTRDHWDALDLDDESAVLKYALECARLSNPVTMSHRVSTEPFSCTIKGKQFTFPMGTKIGIPIGLAMVDKEYWGADAFQFNPNRPHLEESFLGFNSVGGKHTGRECPAKGLVQRTMVKLLQTMGKTRPRKPEPGPQPPVVELPASPAFGCC